MYNHISYYNHIQHSSTLSTCQIVGSWASAVDDKRKPIKPCTSQLALPWLMERLGVSLNGNGINFYLICRKSESLKAQTLTRMNSCTDNDSLFKASQRYRIGWHPASSSSTWKVQFNTCQIHKNPWKPPSHVVCLLHLSLYPAVGDGQHITTGLRNWQGKPWKVGNLAEQQGLTKCHGQRFHPAEGSCCRVSHQVIQCPPQEVRWQILTAQKQKKI